MRLILRPLFRQRLFVAVSVCLTLLGSGCFAQAAWDGEYYEAGETLNPECSPTEANCDVNPVTDVAHGGTGLTSYTAGDLLYATSSSVLGRLALGIDGKILKVVGGTLAWADDSAGTAFSADGDGIELSGSTFSLELDGASLAKSASGLRVSATYTGQNTITTLGTITSGTWNGTAIGDAYLTKSGDWTGIFDGQEGAYYLGRANHTGTQTAATISDFTSSARGTISSAATGLTYSSSTGVLTATTGYAIPTTSSATNWDSAFGWGNHASAGYAILGGKAGGQTLIGGTAANNTLILQANSASGNTSTNSGIQFRVGDSGGTTAMTILNSGNVGIGNAGPTHKVDIVAGALATTQKALSITGTLSGTVARQIGAQMDFTSSAGNTNENDGLFVRLLPGNTSSAYNIAGLFTNTVAGTGTNLIGGTANYGIYGDAVSTTAGTNIGFYGQASGGNISIGASGSSTIAKDSATNVGIFGLGRNTGTSGIQLGGYFGLSSSAPTFASSALMADNGSTTSPIFVSRDNGTEVFRIDDGGRVGIGITSPQQLLDVSAAQPIVRITNTTNLSGVLWAGTEIAKLEFYSADPSGPSIAANMSIIGSADSTGGVPGGDLAFFTKNVAGTLSEKMRITGNGNVGINNTAPGSYGLRLTGTRQAASGDLAVVSFENAGTSSADVLTLKQTGEAGSSESAFVNFYTNLGLVGSINSNGSGVTSYSTTSDRRIKDNIEDTTYGIDDVLKIPVRDYTMQQDPKHAKQTGFIAQELAAIYPDAVSANGDDGLSPLNGKTPWSVDYGRLTPLLVKSIQDQQALLGDIADQEGLSNAVAETRTETPFRALEYISEKIEDGWRPLRNLAALRLTALRGYFEEVFAKKSHQEELCVGTPGNETCLTKPQLDALLNYQPAQSVPPPETADSPEEEPPVESIDTPPSE